MTRIYSIGVCDQGINKYIRIPNVQTHSRLLSVDDPLFRTEIS